jgi:hypothetical protein
LGDNGNLGIGNIWKGINRHVFETYKAQNCQNPHPNKSKTLIFNGKSDDIFYEFIHFIVFIIFKLFFGVLIKHYSKTLCWCSPT